MQRRPGRYLIQVLSVKGAPWWLARMVGRLTALRIKSPKRPQDVVPRWRLRRCGCL
jgi:hypothetical protein